MQADNIQDFKSIFIGEISSLLQKENYKFKPSKGNKFENDNNDHLYSIFLNFYRRPTFIEIQTQCYYGNSEIERKLKNNYSKYRYKDICGGEVRFICEYFFKQIYEHKYSNLIYFLNTPIDSIINMWLTNYTKYIIPFFQDCSIPEILNKIVNEDRINTTGMNLTYENRVLKALFVGELVNISKDQLIELSNKYENYLREKAFPFLSNFMEVKHNLLGGSISD
jgi:hypothetical protein